ESTRFFEARTGLSSSKAPKPIYCAEHAGIHPRIWSRGKEIRLGENRFEDNLGVVPSNQFSRVLRLVRTAGNRGPYFF
ncbi:MAG: hypothetical protein VX684_01365, partial [Planctomycetota bacterium]|nr:hypothetical protein [Planctomycetota bacterium]